MSRPRGRPPTEGEKHDRQVLILLTPTQLAAAKKRAEARGLTVGKWCRDAVVRAIRTG